MIACDKLSINTISILNEGNTQQLYDNNLLALQNYPINKLGHHFTKDKHVGLGLALPLGFRLALGLGTLLDPGLK